MGTLYSRGQNLSSPPARFFVPLFQKHVRHSVNRRNSRTTVPQNTLYPRYIAIFAHQMHGVNLAPGMCPHVLRHPKRRRRAFNVMPNRLPAPVFFRIPSGKNPHIARSRAQIRKQIRRKTNQTPLSGLMLCNPHTRRKLPRPQGEDIGNAKPGM